MSGRDVGREHVRRLADVLQTYAAAPLPRFDGAVNRSLIAKARGFDRKVLSANPKCAELLAAADAADQQRHPTAMARAEAVREHRAGEDRARSDLEGKLLRALAENASLRSDLARLRRLETIMVDGGRLP
jgi:hypothetical protein